AAGLAAMGSAHGAGGHPDPVDYHRLSGVNRLLLGDMRFGNVYDAAYFSEVARLLTDLVRDEHAKVAQQQQVADHAQNKDKRSHR
ncbi:TPA: hypothetical protein ACXIGT_003912, partial [Serratia marcescens]